MRLIDADALLQKMGDVCSSPEFSRGAVKMAVISAPTIGIDELVRHGFSVCDLCADNPPSSRDGKSCSYCPASTKCVEG